MTIKSMTGFGRAELEHCGRVWSCEVRSVNNRYLDLKMKLPRGYASIEEKIRKKVSIDHQRGRVDLYLSVSGDFSDLQEVKVNKALAAGYHEALLELGESFGLDAQLAVKDLALYPDVIVREQKEEDLHAVWEFIEQVTDTALENCTVMRQQEGKALREDLEERLEIFSATITSIEQNIPELLEQRKKGLEERLEKILGTVQLDPARLAQEVALIADKTDVTEEIVRLRSHIEQFTRFLNEDGGVGRKLDFLIQEFLREVNTLASKITDAAIAHHTVGLKSELEKMREQVQNIE
jgi:uncharacterized protein (TIGR00255 family)